MCQTSFKIELDTPTITPMLPKKMNTGNAFHELKAGSNILLIVVALVTYWFGQCNASAFYDPGAQRWLNRDPLGDEGVLSRSPAAPNRILGTMLRQEVFGNIYSFNHDNPMGYVDSDGRFVIAIPAVVGGTIIAIGQGATIGLGICLMVPSCRDALTQALRKAWPKAIDKCRSPDEEAERKKCVQECHDLFEDPWELSICIRRCNGGWSKPNNPPRPIWPN